jgi:hypothetical protein
MWCRYTGIVKKNLMKLSQDSYYIFNNNNISIITGFRNNLRMIHIYMSVNAVKFLIEKR